MPDFGEIIFSPLGVYVAALNIDNTYGTPELIDYVQSTTITPEHDTDTIKAYGMNLEALSILIGAQSELEEASLSYAAKALLIGETPTVSGVAPNQIAELDSLAGGAGTPYFGVVYTYAATNGGAFALGFPKSKLDTQPEFEVEQNTFRTGTLTMNHLVAAQTSRKLMRQARYESAADLPDFTSASAFDTFLGALFT